MARRMRKQREKSVRESDSCKRAYGWHAAKLRLTGILFPIGFAELVRAGAPDLLVICDRGSPCLRLLACHLQTTSRPNGDCSSSTTSVDHRGPPSVPRPGLGIHSLNRWPVKC